MKRLAALASFKMSAYLRDIATEELFDKYSLILEKNMTEEEMNEFSEEPEMIFWDDAILARRYGMLCRLLDGDRIALTALQLVLLLEMEPLAESLLDEVFGSDGVTIEIAGKICFRDRETIEMMPLLRDAYDRAEILLSAECEKESFLRANFLPDGRLAAWLRGDERMERGLKGCRLLRREEELPRLLNHVSMAEEAAARLNGGEFLAVQAVGEKTSGRGFLLRHVAQAIHVDLLEVPAGYLIRQGALIEKNWRRVKRELLLTGSCLCIRGIEDREEAGNGFFVKLEREYNGLDRPLFLATSARVKAAPFFDTYTEVMEIPENSFEQSVRLWNYFAEVYLSNAKGFPAEELAVKMTLTAGQIQKAVKALAREGGRPPYRAKEIFDICYRLLDDGRYENVTAVRSSYTWEDLKTDGYTEKILRNICNQVLYQRQVFSTWGLQEKYPYGRSISALFSGPPGTGKTMAAQVIANELGLALYKIDLSQIVDKYIGETEKRLKEVFDRAEKSNMILLFDEADALLGKRSEVKDARDKYANTEVAYLLQKMEEYRGVVLMTTNLVSNIDQAFLRRFRYHVSFSMPDEHVRRQLWESLLNPRIPQDAIDISYLAKQFELSGSQIKNILLNACYQAAGDGGILCMRHLIESIYQDGKKEGRLMLASEFGIYGSMVSEMVEQQK